jgi:osmotically-inducible protein OsmY
MNRKLNVIVNGISSCLLVGALTGCGAAAVGAAGAEAGYVAAQEDRSAGETIDDQVLVTKVKSKLLADRDIAGLDINVDSFKSVVTLKGVVDSAAERDKALEIARSTGGVRGVRSQLYIAQE